MKLDIDAFLAWRFDLATCNCWHLVRAAWRELTGTDLGDRTPERITTGALLGRFDTDVPAFKLQEGPVEPSIVLMRRRGVVPHVGVFTQRRVLQMRPEGVSHLPPEVATQGWDQVGYYQ